MYGSDNVAFEFNGCIWHGCNKCTKPNQINFKNGKTMRELFNRTVEKKYIIEDAGFDFIKIWECEFKDLIKNGDDPEINYQLKEYLDNLQLNI
jgi:G:T-mismatch repair DNA endonuclease (very short patch repair protein)